MNEWRLPYPHEIGLGIGAIAAGIIAVHLFPDGSLYTRLAALAALLFSGTGGIAAVHYQSPRIKQMFAAHDQDVKTALAASPSPPASPSTIEPPPAA